MEVVHPRCAGIDIGKRSLTVCVIRSDPSGEPVKETRTFRTLTRDLFALADWLDECGVTAVAMEATGSYWKPIWNLLEDRFELLLANAAHLKAVPGRKTDVRDASASCASSCAIGRASSASAPRRSTGSPRCSRAPTSSWGP